jgi:hypothetical protein
MHSKGARASAASAPMRPRWSTTPQALWRRSPAPAAKAAGDGGGRGDGGHRYHSRRRVKRGDGGSTGSMDAVRQRDYRKNECFR